MIKKKKAGSAFLALCMAATLLPGAGTETVLAEGAAEYVDYVPNSSFEEGAGNWKIEGTTNKLSVADKAEDAHTGTHYVSAWSSNPYSYSVEQTFDATKVPVGKYNLYSYYQGTNITELTDTRLYITLTYADSSTTTLETKDFTVPGVFGKFAQVQVKDVEVKENLSTITVGTSLGCNGNAWIALDDMQLIDANVTIGGENPSEPEKPDKPTEPEKPDLPSAPDTPAMEYVESDKTYVNDIFWEDTDGNTIYSQGGGIFEFDGTYYWYGVKYEEAEAYAKDPSKIYNKSDVFVGVTCYSSKDLKNWKYEGLVAEPADVYNAEIMGTTTYQYSSGSTPVFGGPQIQNDAVWVGRLGVTKLEDGTYALLVQHECADEDNSIDDNKDSDKWSKQVLVMTSDSPTGHFKWNNRINMFNAIGTTNTGDQTVFVDDDGTGWLVYSYGKGRGKMYLSKIMWDENEEKVVLDTPFEVYKGAGREGNCMFKYNGKYYLCASDLYGWNASHGYYIVIDPGEMSLEEYLKSGQYKAASAMELMEGTSDDFCHVTQTGFFYTVKGTKQETVIFCGDRWAAFARNGLGFNQWCPLSFDEDDVPYFNSLSAWNLDSETGLWSVADENNYVKNGSFDADRVAASDLAGWTEKTYSGSNAVSNTNESVTGKYALKMGAASEYDAQVSQVVESTPYIQLPDGIYTMTAQIKTKGSFDDLRMYAESGEQLFDMDIKAGAAYETVTLENIVVKNHQVVIGFRAAGNGSECDIDDVTLVPVMTVNKVDRLIKALGSVSEAQAEVLIKEAKEAYEALADAELKAEVSDFGKIEQVEKSIAEKKNADKDKPQEQKPQEQKTPETVKVRKPEAVGSVIAAGSAKFVVTNASEASPEVELKQFTNKKAKKYTIPATITGSSGVVYKVTGIAKNALKGNKKLTAVTIPATVTTIGANAFSGDKNLKTVKIKSAALKSVGKNAFKGISKKAVIKVPKKQKKAYQKLLQKKGQPSTVKIK